MDVTVAEFINYRPPILAPVEDCTGTTLTYKAPSGDMTALHIQAWDDFVPCAKAFVAELASRDPDTRLPSPRPLRTRAIGSEKGTDDALMMSIAPAIDTLGGINGLASFTIAAPDGRVRALTDRVLLKRQPNGSGGKELVVRALIEVKSPYDFPSVPNGDLCAAYAAELKTELAKRQRAAMPAMTLQSIATRSGGSSRPQSPGLPNSFLCPTGIVTRAVNQLWTYLTIEHMTYGVVSTYNETYFCCRVVVEGRSMLKISHGVRADGGRNDLTILAAWLYFMHKTNECPLFSSPADTPTMRRALTPFLDMLSDPSYTEIKTISLSLLESTLRTNLESGASLIFKLPERSYFVKIYYEKNYNALQKARREQSAYQKLRQVQGTVVPRYHGTYRAHGILLMFLELCGRRITADELVSRKQGIYAALCALHGHGVLHNDVAIRNIMIDKSNRVRIIDFDRCLFQGTSPSHIQSRVLGDEEWDARKEAEEKEFRPE